MCVFVCACVAVMQSPCGMLTVFILLPSALCHCLQTRNSVECVGGLSVHHVRCVSFPESVSSLLHCSATTVGHVMHTPWSPDPHLT